MADASGFGLGQTVAVLGGGDRRCETFESALVFGQTVLKGLGLDEDQARDAIDEVRQRDGGVCNWN